MKKLLFALMLLAGVAYGQSPTNYTRIVGKYRWTSGMFDSMFYVPRYNGTPSSVRSGETSVIDGAVAVDTANSRFYIYSGGTWVRVGNYSEITGLAVDSVWRVAGKDSIFWRKNSVTYAIKDSSNVGTVTGTGTTNYVSKFTGTNTIGNSQLTDASNILAYTGVSSNAYLHIKSPAGYFYPQLTFYSNGGVGADLMGYLTRLYITATGGLYLNGGGTGNVMIGTNTDAGQRLQVTGNAIISGGSSFPVLTISQTSSTSGDYIFIGGTENSLQKNITFRGLYENPAARIADVNNGFGRHDLKFYTYPQGGPSMNTTENLSLNGDLTSKFNGAVDIVSSTYPVLTLRTSSSSNGDYLFIGGAEGSLQKHITFRGTYENPSARISDVNNGAGRHDLRFFTYPQGGPAMNTSANLELLGSLTSVFNGTVGIGTGSPSYTLDVTGKIRGTDSAFFATSSGSVGIGTTSPDSLLTVNTGTHLQRGVRMSGIPKGAQTYSLYVNASGTIYKDTVINNYATTYTPTLTNTTNIDSSTAFTTYYKSDGDWVHVWGEVEIDPTAATTLTVLEMDLPVETTINASRELAGTAATEDNSVALIKGNTLNTKAMFRLKPNHSTLSRYSFTFSYKILNP